MRIVCCMVAVKQMPRFLLRPAHRQIVASMLNSKCCQCPQI